MSQQRVALRRQLLTHIGKFSAGCVFPAERVGTGWRLNLLPAPDGGFGHTATVADAEVQLLGDGARPPHLFELTAAQLDRLAYEYPLDQGVV